ncbi:pentatricopeptide repeat-containing protein At1g20230 isoform X1 [Primulina eburnea]|uniref:pentatricopeptide repeat-containing protein At1g20230 isoform X1 n=2 Tax=Primulina eburnea TaxID=1245227 RepID=UPI003C6CB33F
MFSLNAMAWNCAKPFPIPVNFSLGRLIVVACSCTETIPAGNPGFSDSRELHYSDTRIEETLNLDFGKLRLDSWIASRINGISRARVQSSIRSGLVSVIGHVVSKVSHVVRDGDMVHCTISELHHLRAGPEDSPLDIVFDDEHVLVVNKSAHMDQHSLAHIAGQFKEHSINKVYPSFTSGVPSSSPGCVDIPIGRDVNNRILMIALPGSITSGNTRHAVSRGIITPIINCKASFHSNPLFSISDPNDSQEPFSHQPNNCSDTEMNGTMQLNFQNQGFGYRISSSIDGSSEVIAQPNIYSVIGHLLSPNVPTSLCQTRQVHAQLLKTYLFDNPRYNTKLLSLYAACQCISDAKTLIRSLINPDIFSFTTLIYASSKFNDFKNTLSLFSQMLSNGIFPDVHVLPSVIKACTGLLSSKIGKQVHGYSLSFGLFLDPFIGSSLVHLYVKCDELDCAYKVFHTMTERDVQSWSALAAGYARKGDVINAKKVFNEVRNLEFEPNSVSWNGMIAGFNQSGCFLDAVLMFQQMHSLGFKSDGTNISSVLPAIGNLGILVMGIQIHNHVMKMGFVVDKCIVSALINMYGKCGCSLEMSRVFEEMRQVDVGACNALIAGLSRHGLVSEALEVFKGFRGQQIELNVVSWTSVIACCSQHGKDIEALDLFREMQVTGVKPNSVTIPCMLPACGNIAALTYGKAAHCFSLKAGISNDVYVGSALIDMYANCGRIQIARCCFDRMPLHNLVCWNVILGAYAMHGKGKEALEIFAWMQRSGQKPDSVSFTSLLSACSQSGLTEEGRNYFENMSVDHGIEARLEHYACIISLLGRAGKLDEAYSMIEKMPFEPDACVWGALLSSCRLHHNTSLGELAAHKLFELEPSNPGNYILLSNIYASKGKWKKVYEVRDIMRDKGLKKNPGCSWIEVKNKVHMLLAGDKSLPQMAQIMDKLNEYSMEMKKSGYFPDTDYVLQDVEDQEKEHILCGHSEKLAVVFGILNTNKGSPLRVTKNLRICGDCHAVIKFISRFERREISVRDTNRYHHFQDGDCSCGDYW